MCEQVGLARDAYDLLVETRLSLSIGRIQQTFERALLVAHLVSIQWF